MAKKKKTTAKKKTPAKKQKKATESEPIQDDLVDVAALRRSILISEPTRRAYNGGAKAAAKRRLARCFPIVIEALQNLASRKEACAIAGISVSLLAKWMSDNDELREKVELAEMQPIIEAKDTLIHCVRQARAEPKYQTSLIFMLKTKGGFVEAGRHDINTKDAEELAREVREAVKLAHQSVTGVEGEDDDAK